MAILLFSIVCPLAAHIVQKLPQLIDLALLERLIDEFKVDGVVDIVLQACHTYNVETSLVGRLVKEKKGISYAVVETDYSQADVGQLKTRMAAFIEML